MKAINSRPDFDALLKAERAILFLHFPWSMRSVESEAIVSEWQSCGAESGTAVYQLIPDGHPFCWQWLDGIFGEAPEQERTGGAVVWLRSGAVAAMAPDAAQTGPKTLARITNDCFIPGRTYSRDSIADLQNEPVPFDTALLRILCCPETHQVLTLADAAVLDQLNHRLIAGNLRNRAGQVVQEKISDGLVRADGRFLYPMRRNIPILLVDEAIPLSG